MREQKDAGWHWGLAHADAGTNNLRQSQICYIPMRSFRNLKARLHAGF